MMNKTYELEYNIRSIDKYGDCIDVLYYPVTNSLESLKNKANNMLHDDDTKAVVIELNKNYYDKMGSLTGKEEKTVYYAGNTTALQAGYWDK